MYRILLILYIIWGGVSIASGQDFNYSFTQLSTNQGLSQASVTSVTMDQKGRLWIGTQMCIRDSRYSERLELLFPAATKNLHSP